MSNHTQGPWVPLGSGIGVVDSRHCRVATIEQMPGNDRAEMKANAALIAASPRLLAALEVLLGDHEMMFAEAHPYSDISWGQCVEVIEARAAIAAARGEQ
jgi:hypothetical protein